MNSPKFKLILSVAAFVTVSFVVFFALGVQSTRSQPSPETPLLCGANSDKIWDVHLIFISKEGQSTHSVHLKVPEPYLNELSRKNEPLGSAIIYATYDKLKPKCIFKDGVYTSMTGKDFLNLYLQAKPHGGLESIRRQIQRTKEKWTKIENGDDIFNHYISRGKKPLDHIFVPKDTNEPDYFIRCNGAHNYPKPYHTCTVRFDYRKKLDVEASFDAERLLDVEQTISKATELIERFEVANSFHGEK